ncbi:hypothetical protein skT53_05250 [Effusibacillus dendaii]|uniref:Amidase domain-containing protein n=1 Tax=Effusibacillus dendaii TaxID=2743772 RepID=A0A7I8DAI8_9BACL|nr:hypothetical protein skT53_05250 [Effusibacillus dendaii]
MNSIGSLEREAGDLKILYSVLSDHQPKSVDLKSFPLFWMPEIPGAPVKSYILDTCRKVIKELEMELRSPVREMDGKHLKGVVSLWQSIILQDKGEQIIEEIKEDEKFHFYREYFKSLFAKSRYDRWILSVLLGARLFAPSEEKVRTLMDEVERLRLRFTELVQGNGVLLTPVFPVEAPKHGFVTNRVHANLGRRIVPYLVFVNAMGYPAATVPVGRTKEGFPFGIQIVGGFHEKEKVLAIAESIERCAGFSPLGKTGSF